MFQKSIVTNKDSILLNVNFEKSDNYVFNEFIQLISYRSFGLILQNIDSNSIHAKAFISIVFQTEQDTLVSKQYKQKEIIEVKQHLLLNQTEEQLLRYTTENLSANKYYELDWMFRLWNSFYSRELNRNIANGFLEFITNSNEYLNDNDKKELICYMFFSTLVGINHSSYNGCLEEKDFESYLNILNCDTNAIQQSLRNNNGKLSKKN